jgi:hypothetical protein
MYKKVFLSSKLFLCDVEFSVSGVSLDRCASFFKAKQTMKIATALRTSNLICVLVLIHKIVHLTQFTNLENC